MRLSIYSLIFLSVIISLSCSNNDDTDTDPDTEITTDDSSVETDDSTDTDLEALILENISYGDNSQQVYDIYLPAGRSSEETKAIILIHGGGWIEGDKSDMESYIPLLQFNHPDHAIVNINYVLAQVPNVPAFPNQFLDIQQVIDDLAENQETYDIKLEYGIIGVSAGAHLGLVYDYSYDTTDDVKFVVDIVGPTDFDDPFYANDPFYQAALAALVDEEAYSDTEDIIAAISPAQLVTELSSPTLLFYGNQDPIVPLTNGQRLETALVDADIAHQFNIYDAGHGDFSEATAIDMITKITGYIDTYLAVAN